MKHQGVKMNNIFIYYLIYQVSLSSAMKKLFLVALEQLSSRYVFCQECFFK